MLKKTSFSWELASCKNVIFPPSNHSDKVFNKLSKNKQIFFFKFVHKKRVTFANRTRTSVIDTSA